MGTHCLGPFLLTTLLQEIMQRTASLTSADPYSVRIVWVTSLMQLGAPEGGMQFDAQGTPKVLKAMTNYMNSKVGECWLASGFAQRLDKDKILSLVYLGLSRVRMNAG
jgi:retinol dehydrogenase 12